MYICHVLKKYSIITLFLFAYTIVLAHSIIPHHHHDDHKMEQSSDHHHGSNHHDNTGEDGLAHEFGNYMHSVNTTDVYQQPDTQFDQITMASLYLFTTIHFKFKVVDSSPPVVSHSNDCIPLLQHCLSSKGLRAPPYTLI